MPDYLPRITTNDDAGRFADQIIGRGVPLVEGGGIVFDVDAQAHMVDPAYSGTEVISARAGRNNWLSSGTTVFASLDARLENIELYVSRLAILFFVDPATDAHAFVDQSSIPGDVATGSCLWLCSRIQDITATQGGVVWTNGTSGVTISGLTPIPFPNRSFTFVSAIFGGNSWTNPGGSYDQPTIQNMAAQLGYAVVALETLIADLKAKGILQ